MVVMESWAKIAPATTKEEAAGMIVLEKLSQLGCFQIVHC
jgi:hypothetical protein